MADINTSIVLLMLSTFFLLITTLFSFRIIRLSKGQYSWILIAAGYMTLTAATLFWFLSSYRNSSDIASPMVFILLFSSIAMCAGIILLGHSLAKLARTSLIQQANEQRFRLLFNSATDEIILTTLSGTIKEVNQVVCDVLEYSCEELKNKPLQKFLTKDLDLPVIIRQLNYGKPCILENTHLTATGKTIPVEITGKMIALYDEYYLIWTIRDISERKDMEKRIMQTIIETEERERKQFARELHDGLGPLLSTIKLYINELSIEGMPSGEKEELIRYSNELIDEAITTARNLSNTMTPPLLNQHGLIKSIESFIRKINLTHKIIILFSHSMLNDRYEPAVEHVLFRIITELINNTLKHAGAETIEMKMEEKNQYLYLHYTDDGKGFDWEHALQSDGIGLKNIFSRLQSVNGKWNFKNKEKGISVDIEIPVDTKHRKNFPAGKEIKT